MADFPKGPHVDLKTGFFTLPTIAYLQNQQTTNTSNNVNSGARIREAEAAAVAAQTAADAATVAAADQAAAATFSAAVAPTALFDIRSGAGGITTSTATVTPTGGTGPYTYAWALVSGDTFSLSGPTSASTTFATSLTAGQDKSAVYRCTVTDSLLAEATCTIGVTVSETS